MDKIILLDWDGPISNSRTWKMPGQVDPVAIQLVNDLTRAGWQTVLTSTIRKNFDRDRDGNSRSDSEARDAAELFMRNRGLHIRWYKPSWRTDRFYTAHRHLEVANWMMNAYLPEDAIFLVVDDERFPHEFLNRGRMRQIYARSDSGIDYLSISEAYRYMEMPDIALDQTFDPPEDV